MRHFIANMVALFIPVRNIRRRVRKFIMGNDKLKILQEQIKVLQQQQMFQTSIEQKQTIISELEKKQQYLQVKSDWLTHNNGQLLLPGRFTEYDLVFAIGATCHISWYLDNFHLRSFTSPLDWTGGIEPSDWYIDPFVQRDTRFREKIDAICNNFADFYNVDNYRQVSDWNVNKEHQCVVNTKNGIRFNHMFPITQSFESYMPEFVKKIRCRADRLQDAIVKSDKILICWANRLWNQRNVQDAVVSDKDIKYAIKKMQQKYPNKEFDFVFFEHDGTRNRFEYDKACVAPGAYRVKSNHFLIDDCYLYKHNSDDSDSRKHLHVMSEMLDNIKLSENAYILNSDIDIWF